LTTIAEYHSILICNKHFKILENEKPIFNFQTEIFSEFLITVDIVNGLLHCCQNYSAHAENNECSFFGLAFYDSC